MPPATYAGECMYENFRIEYHIVNLEYIVGKFIKIEAICYNPNNSFDKEAIFKFSTTNFKSNDERIKICNLIVESIINKLGLEKSKIKKLSARSGKIFYICVI